MDYALVLHEHPEEFGVLLFQAARDVALWGSVEPEKRAGLFRPEAADTRREAINASSMEHRLAHNLTTLTAILTHPEQINPELLEVVCLDISVWAEERAAFATAVGFAQAAALARPEVPRPAARVGHVAMRWGRLARAETWLRRAIGLARRAKDWESYGYAYIALADIYVGQELTASARRYYTQAMRVGRRNSLPKMRAAAMHGLARVTLSAAEAAEAEARRTELYKDAKRYAHAALRAFGRGHPRLPEVMHDIARLMVLMGEYERAVSYLRKLIVSVADNGKRARLLALLARAAAGAAGLEGKAPVEVAAARETYRAAWSDAWMLLMTGPQGSRDAATLLELVRAAAALRDLPRMEQAARIDIDATPSRRGAARESVALQELVREFRADLSRQAPAKP